ncbi:MAG: preprotein translocase subunit SecG [Burkholderiales bacterium]
MSIISTVAVVIQVLSAIGVIILVLLQHGKGADMGAAFGSGSSGSLFGATGSANFLSRLTAALATVFFVSTLALAFIANTRSTARETGSVMDKVTAPVNAAPPSSVPAQDGKTEAPAVSPVMPGSDAVQKSGGAADIPK